MKKWEELLSDSNKRTECIEFYIKNDQTFSAVSDFCKNIDRETMLELAIIALVEAKDKLQNIIDTNDLCHNKHGKVDARAFADGCADEQRKLYGCAPDADEIDRLKSELCELKNE